MKASMAILSLLFIEVESNHRVLFINWNGLDKHMSMLIL